LYWRPAHQERKEKTSRMLEVEKRRRFKDRGLKRMLHHDPNADSKRGEREKKKQRARRGCALSGTQGYNRGWERKDAVRKGRVFEKGEETAGTACGGKASTRAR